MRDRILRKEHWRLDLTDQNEGQDTEERTLEAGPY
jgi:hypothetical protein